MTVTMQLPRVSQQRRDEALAAFPGAAAHGGVWSLRVVALTLLGFIAMAMIVEPYARVWWIAALAIVPIGIGLLAPRVVDATVRQQREKARRLGWDAGFSAETSSHGVVYLGPDGFFAESGLLREPWLFLGVEYEAATHRLVLHDRLPDSDGHRGQTDVALPRSFSPDEALALAMTLNSAWSPRAPSDP